MKYAIQIDFEGVPNYLNSRCGLGNDTLRVDNTFDNQADALRTLLVRGKVPNTAKLVGVEEIPGETRREVVELKGIVDLRGLKFSVVAAGSMGQLPSGHHIYDKFGSSADLSVALLSPTPTEAVVQFNRNVNHSNFDAGCRIVGIREVTTEPTRRIVELG